MLNIIFDFFSLLISFIISLFLRFNFKLNNINIKWYIISFIIIVIINILVLYFKGVYEDKLNNISNQISTIFEGLIYAIAIYIIISYSVKYTLFSRLTLGYFIVLAFVFQIISRYFLNYIKIRNYKKCIGLINTLIIGDIQGNVEILLKEIDGEHKYGLNIIGVLSDAIVNNNYFKYIGHIKDIKEIINKYNIKSIIITSKVNGIDEIIEFCLLKYISIYTFGNAINLMNYPVEIVFMRDIPVLKIKEILISGASAKLKRLMDLLISFALIIILFPLFILIAILIKITSPGPIFFKHKRLGLNGKLIDVYKFRTMVDNAEEILLKWLEKNPQIRDEYLTNHKLKDDPRITRVGKFLRKTSLDELPQLFNVLKGDMSLVGPRPYLVRELDEINHYAKFLWRVPPGITGLWQISGRSKVDFEGRLKMDMQYIMNWNLWLDINILFKTIPAVLKKDGAY